MTITPNPATSIVLWIGIGLFSLLLSTALLTIGYSGLMYYRDRSEAAVKETLSPKLYEYLDGDDQNWEAAWITNLTREQRSVLGKTLEDHFELVEGDDRERLVELATKVGVKTDAIASLQSSRKRSRQAALKRLTTLRHPMDPDRILSVISTDRVERELASFLLQLDPTPEKRRKALELLLSDGLLTIFGMETLYRVVRDDPTLAFEWLADSETKDPELTAQILTVLTKVDPIPDDAPLKGLIGCLDHDDYRIRTNACLVLGEYGWRSDIRDEIDVESILNDEDPRVRSAAYRMLGKWGDWDARRQLISGLITESDERAIVQGLGSDPELLAVVEEWFPHQTVNWAMTEESTTQLANPIL